MSRPRPTHYAWHDATGRIVKLAYCLPAERAANDKPGCEWIDTGTAEADPARQYINDGALADRPLQATTRDGLVLADLPDPCEVLIEGTSYPVTGGTVTLEFGLPGTYAVRVEAWPYQPMTFEVTAP